MGLAGMTGGRISLHADIKEPHERIQEPEDYFRGKFSHGEIEKHRKQAAETNQSLHDVLMDACGWPAIPFDGKLLITHQDALLVGGKVQAPAGYADHVVFLQPEVCKFCGSKTCIEICSGQAITAGDEGTPVFDREKCVHCGACLWNCTATMEDDPARGNIAFTAGAGGLHSADN